MSSPAASSGADDQAEPLRHEQPEVDACESMEHLREAAAEYYEAGAEQARRVSEMVENYIRQHPVKTLLGAAGAGFLLALLVMRRK